MDDAVTDIDKFLKSIEALAKNKPSVKDFKEYDFEKAEVGDNLFSFNITEQDVPKVVINNYVIGPSEDNLLAVYSADDNTQTDEIEVDSSQNYYQGHYEPEFDYDTAIQVACEVKQLSGRDTNKTWDATVYTSEEDWTQWKQDHRIVRESINQPLTEERKLSEYTAKIDLNVENGDLPSVPVFLNIKAETEE